MKPIQILFFVTLMTSTLTAQTSVRSDPANGQLGIWSDADSSWLVEPLFARVDPVELHPDAGSTQPDLFLLETAGRQGVYHLKKSTWLVPPNYRSVDLNQSTTEAFLVTDPQGRYGMVGPGGTTVLPPRYDRIRYAGEQTWEVEWRGKQGRFNARGEQLGDWRWIKPVVLRGKTYYESNNDGKLGYYAADGTEVLPRQYRYVVEYLDGFRAQKSDGRVGLLNPDFSVRIPFDFTDIQRVVTGLNPERDYVLLARRNPRGDYAIIDERGRPQSDFVFSYNEQLRIYRDAVIDVPHPAQIFIRGRDGEPVIAESFNMVRPFPLLSEGGIPVLAVRRSGSHLLALANVAKGKVVTEFKYGELNRVSPVVEPRRFLPLIEGHTRRGIELLRPDGRRLSDWRFLGVEDYNNWKSFREHFELPDDPLAEAIAWTADLKVFVVYADDRVVYVGTYAGE